MGDSVEVQCLRLAARQHGVISRRQARELGMPERQVSRLVERGRWQTLFPAVYRVEGSERTWHQQLRAALVWAGRGAAISHRAAAALHGFARFAHRPVELSVAWKCDPRPPAVVHSVRALPPGELSWLGGLTVTAPTRTLVDLAAIADRQALRASVDEALRRRWTTPARLSAALRRSGGQRGVLLLRGLVDGLLGGQPPTESELEARVVDLLEQAGFPAPVRQEVVRVPGGVRRIDFRIPGTRVVIEADGYAYHSAIDTYEVQRRRHRALTSSGFRVLPWTWAAVRDEPGALVAELRRALREVDSGKRDT